MREVEFRVKDSETHKILGYEYFNLLLNDGYCYIDLNELKDEMTMG